MTYCVINYLCWPDTCMHHVWPDINRAYGNNCSFYNFPTVLDTLFFLFVIILVLSNPWSWSQAGSALNMSQSLLPTVCMTDRRFQFGKVKISLHCNSQLAAG